MNIIRKAVSIQVNKIHSNYTPIFIRTVTYKSAICLENIYPNSALNLTTPSKPHAVADSKFSGYIPLDQLDITYTKSSGPGGQNVNKVNTKVNIRFQLETANWLDAEIKSKLAQKLKNRITKDGSLLFWSDLTRSQQLNKADCLNKLRTCILEALQEAPPVSEETMDKIRQRQEMASRERLKQKRIRSQTKADRRTPIEM